MTTSSYGFVEFLEDLCSDGIDPDDKIFAFLSQTNTKRLEQLVSRLHKLREMDVAGIVARRATHHSKKTKKSADGQRAALIGKTLEDAINVLLAGCKCISRGANIRTTIAEIDFLISIRPTGLSIPLFRAAKTHILGEAKCYSSGIKTEWINELVGLMNANNATHSILFSAGPEKKLRTDHRQAIQIHSVQGKNVVPFGMAQLKEVLNGANFLAVLSEQYVRVLNASNELSV